MQLTDIREIKGKIELRTGLHIGAGETAMHIGGTDNTVVRHPHTQEPYIPGSSIKGKVRSLLEMKSGLMTKTGGKPLNAGLLKLKGLAGKEREECEKIVKLFGSIAAEEQDIPETGPTRVSFADCSLNEDWRKKARNESLSYFEVKSENSIDRIRGKAEHPRPVERVPAGVVFDFLITLKMLDNKEDALFDYLLLGLKLLELDTLGGNGSRGYGRITLSFDDDEIAEKYKNIKPF